MSRSFSRQLQVGIPLRVHRNGHWYKSVWNPRTKRSEQFYFGKQSADPKGERAISDPVFGWLVRRPAILAGIDNVRVQSTPDDPSLGELMSRFLTFKRNKVQAGELSLTTLGDYLREIEQFVVFLKPSTPAGALGPEHFSAYMDHLSNGRKLGRMARKRIRGYVTAFLRHGAKNGWYSMPSTGAGWTAPATDPDSMRQAKARAGIKDNSDRVLTGDEVDRLVQRASLTFKAMILLAINTGLGPADIGRLTNTSDVIIYVHGWRMKPSERRSYAETAYKRLFLQGFKGEFILYNWPTQWVNLDGDWFSNVWSALGDPGNYSRSEELAFNSAAGLANLLKSLHSEL